ncbi:MAG: twin transmembrane helix small protein [Rhodospirillales bacterium]
MNTVLYILVAIGLIGTLLTLFVGVFSMGRGGAFNEKYGNKLMRLRILFQGFTLIVFVVLLFRLQG